MTRSNSASSTALLTNLDTALCEDVLTTRPPDAEDLDDDTPPAGTLGDDLLQDPPDEYDEPSDLDLADKLPDDLLDLPDERPDDLLDLDLDLDPDDIPDLDLLAELPDKLLALDLVTQLLLPDLLPSASNADPLDGLAADPTPDDDLPEPLLDDSSANPGEEPDTFLDDDDDPSLESTS